MLVCEFIIYRGLGLPTCLIYYSQAYLLGLFYVKKQYILPSYVEIYL